PSPDSRKCRASVTSSIRLGGTSGAMWTCRSNAPRTRGCARAVGGAMTAACVAIVSTLSLLERREPCELGRARGRDRRLDSEFEQEVAGGFPLLDPTHHGLS